jgi:sulfate adenylyltransferase
VASVETKLQVPHGGKLVNLMVEGSEKEKLALGCTKQLELSDRNACDVELLCVG